MVDCRRDGSDGSRVGTSLLHERAPAMKISIIVMPLPTGGRFKARVAAPWGPQRRRPTPTPRSLGSKDHAGTWTATR